MKRAIFSFLLASLLIVTGVGNVKAAENKMPSIVGKAGITMDLETGEVIYANNIDSKYYPASTTKLMTALLFAENKGKTDTIKYTQSAKDQPEYSLDKNLIKMQVDKSTMTGQDTMDALLLFSANDVAYMIADNVSGDSKKFADLMNERAKKLGLKNTHFVSPNGLHNPEHYTTPYDLSVIAREAFKNDWVRETIAKKTSQVSVTTGSASKLLNLENRNKLVGIDGCIGGKTGFTDAAGRVLVAFFDRGGRKMVGVVMKSVYDSQDSMVFDDMKKIIDWSYDAKPVTLHNSGDTVKTETLTYKPFKFFGPEKTVQVPLVLHDDVKYYENDINKKEYKEDYKVERLDAWNLTADKPAGNLVLNEREASKNFKLYSTVSTKDIIKENAGLYIVSGVGVLLIIIVLLGITIKIKNNRRRSSRRYY